MPVFSVLPLLILMQRITKTTNVVLVAQVTHVNLHENSHSTIILDIPSAGLLGVSQDVRETGAPGKLTIIESQRLE